MGLKVYKSVTPSMRHLVSVDKAILWKGKPERSLTVGLSSTGGRNNLGRTTSWKKGGGHKRKYRLIDFFRVKLDQSAVVQRFEYDPNRGAFIALIKYEDGELSYIIAPQKLSVGDSVISADLADVKVGNSMLVRNVPIGTIVHNIELKPKKGAQIARAAGTYAQLIGKDAAYALLKLRSGEIRKIPLMCRVTIGAVSNPDNQNIKIGKAGRNRWLGVRPTVRGVAMNPVDHPHGGGEGKTSGGRHPVTPWGKPTKGKHTRNSKRTDGWIVRSRHKN
ncbi:MULTISPECIES: 50S ribosomal protein L2 [unclassified Candidatus Lariskella]|uniref:50S ribosomal protein L2 n=1 Tax=unclassified Candidatus Lariskella TaxID=2632605 RepID=UPI0030CC3DAF